MHNNAAIRSDRVRLTARRAHAAHRLTRAYSESVAASARIVLHKRCTFLIF